MITMRQNSLSNSLIALANPAVHANLLTQNESAERRYLCPRHIRYIGRAVAEAVYGIGKKHLMVFCPPRHGKSELISHRTPVWFLEQFPDRNVMLSTYGADFSADWGRKVRNTVDLLGAQLTLRLSSDSTAANRWHTHRGGGMIANGVGGSFTGRGGDLLIADDLFKNSEEANSAVHRQKVWEWWNSTFITRAEPGATVILTMTRWHDDDLAGRILKDPEQAPLWRVITLPAIAGAGDEIGRNPGEALWPERMPEESLRVREIQVGDYVWKSLYQQVPPNLDGGAVYYGFKYADEPYGNISEELTVVPEVPLTLAIDFNKRPGSHAVIGQYFEEQARINAIRELFTPSGVAKHIAQAFVQWWNENKPEVPEVHIFGDASGGSGVLTDGRTAWQMIRAEFDAAEIPYSIKVPRKNPGVHDRVEAVNSALCDVNGERNAMISAKGCPRLIRDLQKCVWDKGDLDKTNVELTHASDAWGYQIRWQMPIRSTSARDEDQYAEV